MDHPTTADSTPAHAPSRPRRRPVVDARSQPFLRADRATARGRSTRSSRTTAPGRCDRRGAPTGTCLNRCASKPSTEPSPSSAPARRGRSSAARWPAELAERLTESLRHVHVGWCLNESSALLRREGTEPVQPEVRRDGLADFVDEGLGGLERAVLQLEIGAGRDTRTARAALRLGPRQYTAHREAGLSKLRDAISAQILGRACDQHAGSVVAAATGDRQAMDAPQRRPAALPLLRP